MRGGRGRGVVAGGRDAGNPAVDTMDKIGLQLLEMQQILVI